MGVGGAVKGGGAGGDERLIVCPEPVGETDGLGGCVYEDSPDLVLAGILPLRSAGPSLWGASRSLHLSAPAPRTASPRALRRLRPLPSSDLRDRVHTQRTTPSPALGGRPCLWGVGPDPGTHVWICAERSAHTALPRLFLQELGLEDEWDRCNALVASAALRSPPGWGGGGGGRRRWRLRWLRPDRRRTGSSEGAHVLGDLCVVFGGGCACVTWA